MYVSYKYIWSIIPKPWYNLGRIPHPQPIASICSWPIRLQEHIAFSTSSCNSPFLYASVNKVRIGQLFSINQVMVNNNIVSSDVKKIILITDSYAVNSNSRQ